MIKNKRKEIISNIIYPILSVALALAVWATVSAIKNNPLVLPMPRTVILRFFKLFAEKDFILTIFSTLGRTLISFGISFVFAIIFAIFSLYFNPFHKIITPVVAIIRSAPTVAVILIAYAFFNNKVMSVIVGILIALPIMYTSFYTAISDLDKKYFFIARVYKVTIIRQIFGIILPEISSTLFDTGASTASLNAKIIISAEIITCVYRSIGGKVQTAYASFEIEYLLAWTFVAILVSFLIEGIIKIIKKIVMRWQK